MNGKDYQKRIRIEISSGAIKENNVLTQVFHDGITYYRKKKNIKQGKKLFDVYYPDDVCEDCGYKSSIKKEKTHKPNIFVLLSCKCSIQRPLETFNFGGKSSRNTNESIQDIPEDIAFPPRPNLETASRKERITIRTPQNPPSLTFSPYDVTEKIPAGKLNVLHLIGPKNYVPIRVTIRDRMGEVGFCGILAWKAEKGILSVYIEFPPLKENKLEGWIDVSLHLRFLEDSQIFDISQNRCFHFTSHHIGHHNGTKKRKLSSLSNTPSKSFRIIGVVKNQGDKNGGEDVDIYFYSENPEILSIKTIEISFGGKKAKFFSRILKSIEYFKYKFLKDKNPELYRLLGRSGFVVQVITPSSSIDGWVDVYLKVGMESDLRRNGYYYMNLNPSILGREEVNEVNEEINSSFENKRTSEMGFMNYEEDDMLLDDTGFEEDYGFEESKENDLEFEDLDSTFLDDHLKENDEGDSNMFFV